MTITINIIGAGKVGKTLGKLCVQHRLANILGVYNKKQGHAENAIAFMGQGTAVPSLTALPIADITFITTPDDVIQEQSDTLARIEDIFLGRVFVHCSGVQTSDIFSAVKAKGAWVASVHPMRSFANPSLSVENYPGTYCAIEGDPEAINVIEPLFQAMGAITYTIEKEKKSLYHAAGVFASNYLVTLSEQAALCLKEAGVEQSMARNIIISLMKSSLTNLEASASPSLALTGPIQRGDITTLQSHLSSLFMKEQRALYASLGKATVALTSHNAEMKAELEALLS